MTMSGANKNLRALFNNFAMLKPPLTLPHEIETLHIYKFMAQQKYTVLEAIHMNIRYYKQMVNKLLMENRLLHFKILRGRTDTGSPYVIRILFS